MKHGDWRGVRVVVADLHDRNSVGVIDSSQQQTCQSVMEVVIGTRPPDQFR